MRDFRLLQGTVALITGAASKRGLGRATAQLFAEQGAQVVLLDLDADLCQQVAAELGGGHLGWHCDVTSRRWKSRRITMKLFLMSVLKVLC
jgi:NAD(P)-dependent dehydrogenase (short-subunit alcohol dehydrogenase family)